MTLRPLILSASRRTDLPAYYPDELTRRLERRVRGMRVYELYGVVLWSKDPTPLLSGRRLRRLEPLLTNPALQLTITGLGGTGWEPGVPPAASLVKRLPDLVDGLLGGAGARLRWRFDPIWRRQGLWDSFERIADGVAAVGGRTCTFSFPTEFCLRGSMARRYRALGISPPTPGERAELLAELAERAAPRGLELRCCAQPEVLELAPSGAVEPAQCVPRAVLVDLHPQGAPFPDRRDPSQRKACLCLPSEDVGSYRDDPCGAGCAYCYSRAGGVEGRQAWRARGVRGQGELLLRDGQ